MIQPTLTGEMVCGAQHPMFDTLCDEVGEHNKHQGPHLGRRIVWQPNALTGSPMQAHKDDPESSHRHARKQFGAKGMDKQILEIVGDQWMTCEDIVVALFGPGPYSMKEARRLNKVWTVTLKLYRGGFLDRHKPKTGLIAYRSKS